MKGREKASNGKRASVSDGKRESSMYAFTQKMFSHIQDFYIFRLTHLFLEMQ